MNHRRKYYLLTGSALLFIGLFLFTATTAIQAESDVSGRIAYVDLWAIFNAHPQKIAAEKELNQVAQSMQSELESRASKLPKEEQQDLLEEYQGRLSQQEEGLIQEILEQIREAVREVAAAQGIELVLDKQSVIYGGYDLTQDVIDYIAAGEQGGETPGDDSTVQGDNDGEDSTDGDNSGQGDVSGQGGDSSQGDRPE